MPILQPVQDGVAPVFLTIGHVTRDTFPDGSFSLGGTATFAAITEVAVPTTTTIKVANLTSVFIQTTPMLNSRVTEHPRAQTRPLQPSSSDAEVPYSIATIPGAQPAYVENPTESRKIHLPRRKIKRIISSWLPLCTKRVSSSWLIAPLLPPAL